MGKVWDIEQQIALPFLRDGCLPDELCSLVADLPDAFLQRRGVFAPAARAADFLAQPFAVGVALLQRRLQLAPFRIDREHFVDLELVIAAAGGEPAFDKVGLFANEPDVEHGVQCSTSLLLVISASRKLA